MEIRFERRDDEPSVRHLHLQAFGGHGRKVAALNDDLRTSLASSPGLSLVVTDSDAVVGHAMFTRCLLDAPRRVVDVQVLSPIAVNPGRQGEGLGAALVRRGLDILSDRGVPLVFLEGDPAYYSRLGFRPATESGFRKPSLRIPDQAFQVIKLPAWEPWMTGTFVYSDTFWNHDAVGLRRTSETAETGVDWGGEET